MSAAVPAHLADAVDIAGNGELFWHGHRADEAARWLTGRGLGIIGGESYRTHAVAWGSYLGSWETTPGREPDEAWAAFAERGLRQALAAIAAAPRDDYRYFLATIGHAP